MEEKNCAWCGEGKPLAEFNKKRVRKDGTPGRQSHCRDCSQAYAKRHYTGNKASYLQRNYRYRDELVKAVDAIKEGRPCMDCGNVFPPCVMDFDHRDPTQKVGGISTMTRCTRSMAAILQEIEKCDLVCANCHRIRTHLIEKRTHSSSVERSLDTGEAASSILAGSTRASSKGRTSSFDLANGGSNPSARTNDDERHPS